MLNKAGKTITIFIALTIILLVSSTSIGFYLYHNEQRLHKKVETELDAARGDGAKLQAQLKDIQGQLALAEDKNKEADQKINNLLDEKDLNEGLRAALKKENAALKEQITGFDTAREKMKTDLDDSATKLSQFQELLKASENKSKELEGRLASLAETNKGLQGKIDELKSSMQPLDKRSPEEQIAGETIPGRSGKDKVELNKIVVNPHNGTQGHVLSVDIDAEFVVFNLGLKQGVKPDDMLSVYRGDEYLGDIKATRVQDEMSAADIIPPLSSRELRKNDTVVLKP
jgi:septal ring factor EnvC (AmiA/AmiB activator)